MIVIFLYFISPYLSKIIVPILEVLIKCIIMISNFGNFPLSKVYLPTPKIWQILIYYFMIYLLLFLYQIYNSKHKSNTNIRIRNFIALIKYKFREKKKIYLKRILVIVLMLIFVNSTKQGQLKINFIDVGQGDSTFIVTPENKTILIDGGGTTSNEFDVGKSILLPYVLDRGYNKIDYIFISHFDQDHCAGLLYLMEEIKVKNVIIGKQYQACDNYKKFIQIINNKNINVKVVEAGDRIEIEKEVYFDIIWPCSDIVISENAINNNSLVCKIVFKKFSMLYTGDIEEIAEKAIISKYKKTGNNMLKSNILKVAHHGSKTSSTQEFLKLVKPQYALIGVGKDNKFGHPSDITIENLKLNSIKIFRTDEMGEISIKSNGKRVLFK